MSRRMRAQWEKKPEGWNKESMKKYWETLTGDVKHKVTKCIKKIEESDSGITDAGAFCASLADKIEGTAWRHEPRKKRTKKAMEKTAMKIAFERIVDECPDCMMTANAMEEVCKSCAEKMRKNNIKAIKASAVLDALRIAE